MWFLYISNYPAVFKDSCKLEFMSLPCITSISFSINYHTMIFSEQASVTRIQYHINQVLMYLIIFISFLARGLGRLVLQRKLLMLLEISCLPVVQNYDYNVLGTHSKEVTKVVYLNNFKMCKYVRYFYKEISKNASNIEHILNIII